MENEPEINFVEPLDQEASLLESACLVGQIAIKQETQVKWLTEAPGDWLNTFNISNALGKNYENVRRTIEDIQVTYPELVDSFAGPSGKLYKLVAPEVQDIIKDIYWKNRPPEGFIAVPELADEIGKSGTAIRRRASQYLAEDPSEMRKCVGESNRPAWYLSPSIADKVRHHYRRYQPPPENSVGYSALAKELDISVETIRRMANQIKEEHPEYFGIFGTIHGRSSAGRIYPEGQSIIRQRLKKADLAPDDWETKTSIAKRTGYAKPVINLLCQDIRDKSPELFELFKGRLKGSIGKITEYLSPEAIVIIETQLSQLKGPPPESWLSIRALSGVTGVSRETIQQYLVSHREINPEGIRFCRGPNGRTSEYMHPDIAEEIATKISNKKDERLSSILGLEIHKKLIANADAFIKEIEEGETIEAQEFQKLIQLFGSERAVDILFQYRPEYKKIDVPYVKGILGDYLGEFLVVSNHFQLEDLEVGVRYLSNVSLKEGLAEVLKKDCLAFYNQKRREGSLVGNQSSIDEYLAHMRRQSADYSTLDLEGVLIEVENYYRSLFEIEIPSSMVGELINDRLFPDLNQRINIKQIELKHKMLIADDMGVGKSASAILAKETLGVRQALILAPSNVVEVWQKYLSDLQSENGETQGYFKQSQAPRVLTIESLESLRTINPADYDYIILSQERLTDEYVEALEIFDYGMLIVDEVHKLKNIGSGKRAENLVKLAARIEEGKDDKYLALLSGTPVPNKVGDIAMILKLLYPEKFEHISNKGLTRQILQGDVLDLRSLLVPRMEMKSLAESVEMPKLHEEVHEISLSEAEQDVYEVFLEEDELTATQKLQILRQFILNPSRFDVTPSLESTKIREVGSALRETFSQKNKVVMFVNGYIDGVIRGEKTIFDQLGLPDDVEIHVIDGQVPKARRLEIQRMLQESGKKMLLAVSGQTADVGVDFSGADELYFYNEPWTEYDKKQQQGRVYRPGLKKDLISHTFYVRGTIEEGIHKYKAVKYNAVEKLLRGIPISELEKELLRQDEQQVDPNLEVNPTLAEYYFSNWNRMLKIFNHVKEIGEENFVKFLGRYGREYAECYVDLGSRSYQSNANRLAGTIIDKFAKAKGQVPEFVRILDVASGPEMLKKHIPDEYQQQVTSVDINPHHFVEQGKKQLVGSFLNLPVADSTVDYANLSLALHYTKFLPTKQNYERLKVLSELNRVLTTGGIAVINLMHTLDLKDRVTFTEAIGKLGFEMVEKYSGRAESGAQFVTRLIVLQKVSESPQEIGALVRNLGSRLLQGFKLAKNDVWLRDSRKIVTSFMLDDKTKIKTEFNQTDQKVLEEEQDTLDQMKKLKRQYRGIKNIPVEEVKKAGFARVFNSRRYVLFKKLDSDNGAVITR